MPLSDYKRLTYLANPKDVPKIKERASELGLTISSYIHYCIENDIGKDQLNRAKYGEQGKGRRDTQNV